jgi:hypothetical protein
MFGLFRVAAKYQMLLALAVAIISDISMIQ